MASSAFNVTGLTLNEEAAKSVQEIVYKAVIEEGNLSTFHDIHTGIYGEKQIPFIEGGGKSTKKITDCEFSTASGPKLTQKKWNTVTIGGKVEHCNFKVDKKAKLFGQPGNVMPQVFNPDEGDQVSLVQILGQELYKQMNREIHRHVWLGDTGAATGSSAGNFKSGVDVDYYKALDGLWKQITTAKSSDKFTITSNAENDNAKLKSGETALDILRGVYESASYELQQYIGENKSNAMWLVTPEIFNQYRNERQDKNLAGGFIEKTENGQWMNTYDGIPIYCRYDWGAAIKNDYHKVTASSKNQFNNPHRVVLTVKENIPIGTLSEGDFDEVKVYYSDDKDVLVFKFGLELDVKLLQNNMIAVGY